MTPKNQKDFLIELKGKINKSTEFICNYPTDEDIGIYIWVETKDNMICDDECHYEVIFNTSKNGNPNVASVEVHFEGDNFRNFQNIPLPKELMYDKWEYIENSWREDSRIVYKDKDTDKGDNFNKDIIIERLRKLEQLIGADLRDAVRKKIPAAEQEMYRELLAFQRVPGLAKEAIQKAGNECELDPSHKSFNDKDGKAYMEGHHLIPIARQGNFQNSLNQAENIVCLCPNCHKEIHLGKDRLQLVEKLWKKRHSDLEEAGIGITMPELAKYYP